MILIPERLYKEKIKATVRIDVDISMKLSIVAEKRKMTREQLVVLCIETALEEDFLVIDRILNELP